MRDSDFHTDQAVSIFTNVVHIFNKLRHPTREILFGSWGEGGDVGFVAAFFVGDARAEVHEGSVREAEVEGAFEGRCFADVDGDFAEEFERGGPDNGIAVDDHGAHGDVDEGRTVVGVRGVGAEGVGPAEAFFARCLDDGLVEL